MISRSLTLRDACAFIHKTMNPKVQWPGEHLGIMEAQITQPNKLYVEHKIVM
jgi:hypothetical protein